ncbi:GD16062 [Drosophila simulans]|uniref:GD16062 n=1 Tax=Drosophila simulans TaxID=7240 RepID=B4R744_DROSI|nr:GD16062 [Drosophila simulans]
MNPTPVGIGFGFGRKPPSKARMRSRWRPPSATALLTPDPADGDSHTAADPLQVTEAAPSGPPSSSSSSPIGDRHSQHHSSSAIDRRLQQHHQPPQQHRQRGQLTTLALLLLALVAISNLETLLAVRTEGPRNRHGSPVADENVIDPHAFLPLEFPGMLDL